MFVVLPGVGAFVVVFAATCLPSLSRFVEPGVRRSKDFKRGFPDRGINGLGRKRAFARTVRSEKSLHVYILDFEGRSGRIHRDGKQMQVVDR